MPEDLAREAPADRKYSRSSNATVEAILALRMPLLPVFEAMQALVKGEGTTNPALQEMQAERERLLSLSPAELRATHERLLARAEAIRFPGADMAYWARLERWTLEESIALLLGRDPEKVTAKTLKNHQYDSALPRTYERLIKMARRATAMTLAELLKPADVLAWARESGVTPIPQDLERLVQARAPIGTGDKHTDAEAPRGKLEVSDPASPWTPDELAEMQSFRKRHGTKATAEKYEISGTRIRQLLPSERKSPVGNSVFTHRLK